MLHVVPAVPVTFEGPEKSDFEADYRKRVAAWYPPQADGKTLFPFRRLFIVAQRGG